MKSKEKKIRVGVIGCGAIGSRIAKSVQLDLKSTCQLTGLYDIRQDRAQLLEKALHAKRLTKRSLKELLKVSDLVVEAVNADDTSSIIKQAINAKKHVLAMSVGKLLNAFPIFKLATRNRCSILFPSGAIAGIDAIKAASLGNISSITLTTRKPPKGFANNSHLAQKGMDLSKITKETVLFEGSVDEAVKSFPQNINVAATVDRLKKIL